MGREIPRNRSRRGEAPPDPYQRRPQQQIGDRQRSGFSRRGAPYEVGQSYRYMPHFQEERDSYFSQYEPQMGGGRGGGMRNRDRD